MNLKQA